MTIHVEVINHSTVVTREQLQNMAAAWQLQVRRDFAPLYGIGNGLTVTVVDALTPGRWPMVVTDTLDVANALGYHDIDSHGSPVMKIGAGLDIQHGLSVSVTGSHELLETLLDPFIDCTYQLGRSTFGAMEVCDPVEADRLGYKCATCSGP